MENPDIVLRYLRDIDRKVDQLIDEMRDLTSRVTGVEVGLSLVNSRLMSAGFWFAAPRYNALAASCAGLAAILQFAVLSMPVCRAFA